MSAKQRKYTREFKLEAVRLVQKGNSAVRVAEQLGIRCDMLRHWKQQVESNELGETEVFPGKGEWPTPSRKCGACGGNWSWSPRSATS